MADVPREVVINCPVSSPPHILRTLYRYISRCVPTACRVHVHSSATGSSNANLTCFLDGLPSSSSPLLKLVLIWKSGKYWSCSRMLTTYMVKSLAKPFFFLSCYYESDSQRLSQYGNVWHCFPLCTLSLGWGRVVYVCVCVEGEREGSERLFVMVVHLKVNLTAAFSQWVHTQKIESYLHFLSRQ